MKDMEEIIAAFVDDERVDSDALERALAKPEGRAYLIDLLAMRELVGDRVGRDMASGHPAGVASGSHAGVVSGFSRTWAIAAAILVCATGLAGFGIGQRVGDRTPQSAVQPAPAPASNEPQTVELLTPPAPTRVIKLEAGKDWQDRSGGE